MVHNSNSAAQFATYSLMKSTLAPFLGQDTALHLVSGSLASTLDMMKRGQRMAIHANLLHHAGAVSTTVSAPVWLVKTRMQLQTNKMICEVALPQPLVLVSWAHLIIFFNVKGLAYKNSWDCVRRVYREEGASAFYKGLTASYLGAFVDTSFSVTSLCSCVFSIVLSAGMAGLAIQFSLYEKGKWFLLENTTRSKEQGLSPLEYLAVASASKGIASVITYPHEVRIP